MYKATHTFPATRRSGPGVPWHRRRPQCSIGTGTFRGCLNHLTSPLSAPLNHTYASGTVSHYAVCMLYEHNQNWWVHVGDCVRLQTEVRALLVWYIAHPVPPTVPPTGDECPGPPTQGQVHSGVGGGSHCPVTTLQSKAHWVRSCTPHTCLAYTHAPQRTSAHLSAPQRTSTHLSAPHYTTPHCNHAIYRHGVATQPVVHVHRPAPTQPQPFSLSTGARARAAHPAPELTLPEAKRRRVGGHCFEVAIVCAVPCI